MLSVASWHCWSTLSPVAGGPRWRPAVRRRGSAWHRFHWDTTRSASSELILDEDMTWRNLEPVRGELAFSTSGIYAGTPALPNAAADRPVLAARPQPSHAPCMLPAGTGSSSAYASACS